MHRRLTRAVKQASFVSKSTFGDAICMKLRRQQLHLRVEATPEGYAQLSLDGCLQLVDRCWWRFIIVTTTSISCPTNDYSLGACILMLLVPASSCKTVTRSLSGAFDLHMYATATGN